MYFRINWSSWFALLLPLASAHAAKPTLTAPAATPIDRASWFESDDYPAEARRLGMEGSVDFEVAVNTDGRPQDCRVIKSSGHVILDTVTCKIVLARARFAPPRGQSGKSTVGRYSTTAIWALEDWGLPPATPIDRPSWFTSDDYPFEAMKNGIEGSVDFEVDVNPIGRPTACRVTASSGHEVLDKATCDIVLARARFEAGSDSNGKPVAGRYVTQAIWRLEGRPTSYAAAILDYAEDPDRPGCKVKASDPNFGGPRCDDLLGRAGPIAEITKGMSKVVVMVASATGDLATYQGEPEWGRRLARASADIYEVKGARSPFACISVAAEGVALGRDPCAGVGAPRMISEADKKRAIKTRIEISVFGVMHEPAR